MAKHVMYVAINAGIIEHGHDDNIILLCKLSLAVQTLETT